MSGTAGVSVLFTDLVGSTALSTSVGPADAEPIRLLHFGLLRDAITTHEGTEVKNLGDGDWHPSGAFRDDTAHRRGPADHACAGGS